jgi:excisionase family DNA binding protein
MSRTTSAANGGGIAAELGDWVRGCHSTEAAVELLIREHGSRFVRRLIAERRIESVHVGRQVRISESALIRFVEAGSVTAMPIPTADRR